MTTTTLSDVAELQPLNTKKQVAKWYGCSDRHIDSMVKDGQFPEPIRAGVRSPRWRRSDLLNWLDDQSAGSTADDE